MLKMILALGLASVPSAAFATCVLSANPTTRELHALDCGVVDGGSSGQAQTCTANVTTDSSIVAHGCVVSGSAIRAPSGSSGPALGWE